MTPFAESKNRPTFVDYDVESLLIGLSSYGGDGDDDESSSSSSSSSTDDNNNQEGNSDNNNNNEEQKENEERRQQQQKQQKDLEIGDLSSSTSTTFQDSFSSTSSFYSSTSSTTSTSSCSRMKKSVTFNPQCECAMIPHRSSFTRQERKSMYMTSKEYESFRADARATAGMLSEWGCEMRYGDTSAPDHNNNNLEDDDEDICFLGLEGHTTVGRTLRRSLRGRAARIVYENQHDDENNNKKESINCFLSGTIAKRNNTTSTSSSGSMASQYAKISQSAISFAWMRALKNTDQIREYLESS